MINRINLKGKKMQQDDVFPNVKIKKTKDVLRTLNCIELDVKKG